MVIFNERKQPVEQAERVVASRPFACFAGKNSAQYHSRNEIALGCRSKLGYRWTMIATEQMILQTLLELEATVSAMRTANPKPSVVPVLSRLEELTRQLPKTADPNLLHYLHKRSYEKARLWLEGREGENQAGNCRHV